MVLCDYGCGQEATFTLKTGKNCCSKSSNSCPQRKAVNSARNKATYAREDIKARHVEIMNEVNHRPEKIAKTKATHKERYGGAYFNSVEGKIKSKKTMMENYGVEHALQSSELMNNRNNTNLLRYGYKNPFEDVAMMKAGMLRKYGHESPSHAVN